MSVRAHKPCSLHSDLCCRRVAGGREGACQQGDRKLTSLSRLQPLLHNLTGTLCVALDSLGIQKLQFKKNVFFLILHPKVERKNLSSFRKLYKNYKRNTRKNPMSFSSNRYCLFTSHQNSLHLAACMKHFSLQTT